MDEKNKVIFAVIIFIVVIAIGIGVYYFFFRSDSDESIPVEEVTQEITPPAESEAVVKEESEPLELIDVDLDRSDFLIRDFVKQLSSHPELAQWMMSRDIIRKFTAAVDNIANGQSPRSHIDFISLEEKFEVIDKNGLIYIDPQSFKRYNQVAEVFNSLDTEGCVQLFRRIKPVINEAYKELGYPETDF